MENSISSKRPELVEEWSPRNLPLTPDDVSYGSNKLYWWKGSCGHEWQTSAKARSCGEKCPICSNARIIPGVNDPIRRSSAKVNVGTNGKLQSEAESEEPDARIAPIILSFPVSTT